jgi:hypothetical protein
MQKTIKAIPNDESRWDTGDCSFPSKGKTFKVKDICLYFLQL